MLIKHNGCNAQQHLGKSRANNDAGALLFISHTKKRDRILWGRSGVAGRSCEKGWILDSQQCMFNYDQGQITVAHENIWQKMFRYTPFVRGVH